MNYTGSLHNHTDYSNIRLRDCIIKLEDGISYAEKLGHRVIAITDHEFTGSWIKAQKIAKKHPDIKVILGNEIYLCRNGLNTSNYNREYDRYYHFILLAKDRIGARQIMEISTRAWRRSYMARGMRRVPTYYQDLFDVIGADPGHVIGSTACLGGALPTQLLRYRASQNEQLKDKIGIWIEQMDNLFGRGNFYLEMQPNNDKDQIYVNQRLLDISNATGIPYIITTDSHYLRKEDRVIHKAYLNAQNGDREVDSFYATTYMMSTEELESYFKYLSREQLDVAYTNIENIMNMCEDYSLEKPLRIPDLQWKNPINKVAPYEYFDKIPSLKELMDSEYIGDHRLADNIVDGIMSHPDLQNEEAYKEIDLCIQDTLISSKVNNAHWSAYYLNLQKIIDVCWEADSIVGPGRGSGVGFILLYVLGITQINPLREKTKTFRWRFLNPERVSVLDVDFDIEGSKRAQVFNKFREVYGEEYVANVATFKTEKSKSAILTAARGLGIDVDIAQYIASLIPADRGLIRSLDQCMYGDIENDLKPIKQFVFEMENNYPELWNVARNIEGLICSSGIHAGGVIFVDEPFTESTALMRAPDGTICTQFELHDAEAVSLIKYDALSVEAMDKIHNCINLICDYGYAERKATLKDTYESLIGIYNINRDDPKMWKMVWNHDIQSLFQMEKQSGIQGIATLKPTSVDDLAILNSTIRLMAQERGGEMPTNKLARFKRNPNEWLKEMNKYGLGEAEQKILSPVLSMSYGLCIAQEQFMELVQLPELGGFSLTWADKLRKSIAKKNPKDYDTLTADFYKTTEEKGINQKLAHYVWDVLIAMSKGYGFNQSHTLAYSLIALQEMNLACYYPIVFWNCACLINDAGGEESDDIENSSEEEENEISWTSEVEDFNLEESDEEDDEDEDDEDELKEEKKKKKAKKVSYGKIASAIGKMKMENISVTPPDINYSSFTFSPDPKKNLIRYGLSGITGLGDDAIKDIISNRPYTSLNDLLQKVKLKKPQVINLIKAGAFDEFGDRYELMYEYVGTICDAKKRITLQNMQMMINYNMIPVDFDFQVRVFNFNKYLKKFKSEDKRYYLLDNIAIDFYEKNFDIDKLMPTEEAESSFMILIEKWDYAYQKQMDIIRPWVKKNADELLKQLNNNLMQTTWDKYCKGSFAKWEMDSTSCYFGEHELDDVNYAYYDFEDFFNLPDTPDIDNVFTIKGKTIPIFRLSRIVGTVLDRNKNKKLVTLLTKTGVVTVKIYGDAFTHYDKQLSVRGADGKKHVIEKSWFSRGNKIIVTGIRQEDGFLAKKYSRTPYHLVELVTQINNDGTIETRGERAEVEE